MRTRMRVKRTRSSNEGVVAVVAVAVVAERAEVQVDTQD